MVNMHVSYADIQAEAGKLDAMKEQIQSDLTTAQTNIQNLTSGGFVTDQASAKFAQTYEQFTTGAKLTIDAMSDLATMLRQTAQALQDTDTQLASQMG